MITRRIFCSLLILAASAHADAQCLPSGAAQGNKAASDGYRYVIDPVLHQEWKVTVSSDHPEYPARMEEVPFGTRVPQKACGSTKAAASPGPRGLDVVSGSPVTVWRSQSTSRLMLAGTATANAHVGESLTVRLASGALVVGQVTGPGLVRLEIPAESWRQR